ncbi:phosphatidylserine decarboxylase [Xylophilus sp. Kf1]|nr:phosphatidylserine decarboxylase [Xylophilus sp. Kf1]
MNPLRRFLQQEDLNFLLTNRVPRLMLTRWMGWFSQLRNPLLCRLSIGVWRLFTDLDLSDARRQAFASLHECFTRELVPGARPVDPDAAVLSSPCDAIVGACGPVRGRQVFQAKGFPYAMADLFGPTQDSTAFDDGHYVTLRLTSSMYHRFHAPADCEVEHVTFIHGDTWNVNPIALARVERLFCRNERAVLRARTERGGHSIAIVPVAAILVASLRLHFLDLLLHQRYRGANEIACRARFAKGEEMGWFQHGSTILVFVPAGFGLCDGIAPGVRIRMGQALMRMPA